MGRHRLEERLSRCLLSDSLLQEGGGNDGLYMKTSFSQGDAKVFICNWYHDISVIIGHYSIFIIPHFPKKIDWWVRVFFWTIWRDWKVTKICRAKRNREVLDFSKKSTFRYVQIILNILLQGIFLLRKKYLIFRVLSVMSSYLRKRTMKECQGEKGQ